MARYCITMERSLRISKWFDAENDEEAREQASLIHLRTEDEEYDSGDSEYDYALVNEDTNRTLVWWNR